MPRKKAVKTTQNGSTPKFITYRPLKEDKQQISEKPGTLLDVANLLQELVEAGAKVTLEWDSRSEAVQLRLFSREAKWPNVTFLCFYHTSIERLFYTFLHGIKYFYGSDPAEWDSLSEQLDFDW